MVKLSDIKSPKDLKQLNTDDLNSLSDQIREFLIDKVSKTGGHLASNLGIVEITLAMHKVFNSPIDKFIFDVGHQSYVHKILTGRQEGFDHLRQYKGMSGFPKVKESKHDCFETGHSTTSLSAAFGMAKARDLKGENNNIVAVIGDGALTGGMAYEALNNIGASKTKMIIILNDNGMSISPNIGSVSNHLVNLRTSKKYINTKTKINRRLGKSKTGQSIHRALHNIKENIKYSVIEEGGVLFEELGFTYLGPVDGHSVESMIEVLERAKSLNKPVIIHAITQKGKGYIIAEKAPNKFHGPSAFDPDTGLAISKKPEHTFSQVMGDKALEMGKEHKDIVAITAAMTEATGLYPFAQNFPNRFFDVGIAEQHAVTFAAGLARGGMHPIVAIYSSFLQRSYDQVMMDVCLQNLPVIFAIDRAGFVGADGETHNGMFDISYLSAMPNMTILCPADGNDLQAAMDYAYELNSPVAIRYPRGACKFKSGLHKTFVENELICNGSDIEILAVGPCIDDAMLIKDYLDDYSVGIRKITKAMPFDLQLEGNKLYVSIEDGSLVGGFGQILKANNNNVEILSFAWPRKFIEHGSNDQIKQEYKLDAKSIAERIKAELERKA
ncbi:MAG: 1-deoxy-D-xylulose-5-phosphate synthase [Clostridia bacterium]|nr:1-deoxy-D-xylulose-5-phosphate synthase [Clostridia bacterium]